MKDVSPAAIYASLLPDLIQAGRDCGYAVAPHGSMARDFDLVAVPWTENATSAEALILRLLSVVGGHIQDGWSPAADKSLDEDGKPKWEKHLGDVSGKKPHGRQVWSIHLGQHSNLWLDVSVMPRLT
jgi:hypothetical protein